MNVTLKQLIEAAPVLQTLDAKKLSMQDMFTIGTIIQVVNPHLGTYNNIRNKNLQEYAKPVEEDKNRFKFNDDVAQAKFVALEEELQSQSFPLRLPKLTMAQVEQWDLSALEVVSIAFLIKDKPVVELED